MINEKNVSGTTLAYLGDALWSLIVREYLVELGYNKPKDLQSKSVKFVSAKAQANIFHELDTQNFFEEDELEVFKRGRNSKSQNVPKNTSVQTYVTSTGFEAIIGYWYINKNETRIKQLWEKVKTYKGV